MRVSHEFGLDRSALLSYGRVPECMWGEAPATRPRRSRFEGPIMWEPTVEHPLRRLFAGLAEHAFLPHLGVADPPMIDYLSSLLSRFVHFDAVYRLRGEHGRCRSAGQAKKDAGQRNLHSILPNRWTVLRKLKLLS